MYPAHVLFSVLLSSTMKILVATTRLIAQPYRLDLMFETISQSGGVVMRESGSDQRLNMPHEQVWNY